ncbi:putative TIM-barrel fold metal-dependent hydrolase [Metallosphaera yellowstonensis MK1]|jgi:predicted TIM-barrel fold metal-dependent hydrolase|uniref:Putative TIM-barrel fold metal-dependent hydrolase n=1 Tax=Metallosphaera yellowstonensis MK1 TaxID=671065 RepID=H2C212_9CREN|nr:amidohydrolase family protein [Metallosphaera yellowstonensis]EHP70283.1 putative TIM-barrel fold metal-dependent hydrolase [Metallosphaera yellowstonensis MK1]
MADVEIVDVHSHFYPKTYVDKLMRRGFAETREGQVILKWGRRGSPASISAVNLEEKVKEVKKFSPNSLSLLSVSAPWGEVLPRGEELGVVRKANDELSEIVRKNEGLFGGLAMLPTSDVEASAEEAERAIKELNLHGFVVGTGMANRMLEDGRMGELLKVVEKLGRPIFLHPGTLPLDKVLNEGPAAVGVSFVFETTYVLVRMALQGLLRDYDVKVICPHGGGFIPYQLGRADLVKSAYDQSLQLPSQYLRRNVFYDTVMYTEESLRFLVEVMGEDQVVFGTDHPFPVSRRELFLGFVQKLYQGSTREKILRENAMGLFGIR